MNQKKVETPGNKSIYDTIGERIRLARNTAKMSQQEYAKVLGISQTYLSSIELNKAAATADVIQKVHELSGFTLDWLYYGKTLEFNAQEKAVNLMQLTSINNILSRMDTNQLTFVRTFLESYIKSLKKD